MYQNEATSVPVAAKTLLTSVSATAAVSTATASKLIHSFREYCDVSQFLLMDPKLQRSHLLSQPPSVKMIQSDVTVVYKASSESLVVSLFDFD